MLVLLRLPIFVISLLVCVTGFAQQLPVMVTDVDFQNDVRPLDWWKMEIELEARRDEDPAARHPEFLTNVKVTVTLGFERAGVAGEFDFFQSSMELLAMEQGEDYKIAFWIPEEIQEAFQLQETPDYWLIELSVNGRPIPPSSDLIRSTASPKLRSSPQLLSSFKARASAGLGDTDGFLLPTHLTPYPLTGVDDEPAPVRRYERP